MPRKGYRKYTRCAVEGCPNPPATVGKNTQTLPCCRDHMKDYLRITTRNGVRLTGMMRDTLVFLRDAYQQDAERVTPMEISRSTAQSLFKRDWIFISKGVDGITRYKITSRGLTALERFEAPIERHRFGLCPSCNTRPRALDERKRAREFCAECQERIDAAVGKMKPTQVTRKPTTTCARSGCTEPRHQYSTGRYSHYCTQHEHEVHNTNYKRYKHRDMERIRNGEPPPICPRCKTRPVRVCPDSLGRTCVECERPTERERMIRRKLAR